MKQHSPEYDEYMKSDEWALKKATRLVIDDYKCCMCHRPVSTCKLVQCHHVRYKNLGNEDVYQDLATLCGTCHKKLHDFYKRVREPEQLGYRKR